MTYSITKSDGQIIVVADGTINNSTSVTLVGRNYPDYGTVQNDNFIKLLENSSDPIPPTSPITGELWWDSGNSVLKVFTGTQFKPMSSVESGPIPPTSSILGDLWWNTSTNQLMVYNNSSWVLIGPQSSSTTGQTGPFVNQIIDTLTITHTVIEFYVSNNLVAILSTDQSFTPSPPISGFLVINPGLNLISNSIISNIAYTGTVLNSEALNGISSSQFMRSDANTSTTGTINVLTNNGLFVGLNSDLKLSVSGTTVYVNNETVGGSMNIGTTNSSGTTNNAISVDPNGNVTFNNNVVVNGSFTSSLNSVLNLTGNVASTSTSTGTLTVVGGIGATGAVNIGGSFYVAGTGLIVGNATVGSITTAGQIVVSSTIASSTVSTGSVVIGGGVGVGGSLNIGGNLGVNTNVNIGGSLVSTGTISTYAGLILNSVGTIDFPSGVVIYEDSSGNGPGDIVIRTNNSGTLSYTIFHNNGTLEVPNSLQVDSGTIQDSAGVLRLGIQAAASSVYKTGLATGWMHQFQDNVGTAKWVMNSDYGFYSSGDVIASWSDERLKENIISVDSSEGLGRVLSYRVVDFTWNDIGRKFNGKQEGIKQRGLIAQEVREINSEVVTDNKTHNDENGNPYLTVSESKIVFDLIGAVQSLQSQILELKNEIDSLKGL